MGLMDDRRRVIAAQPHLVRAAGNPLTCVIAEPKIERLAVMFNPTQSGSGTQTPTNIRTIGGHSTVSVSIGSQTESISLGGTYYGGTVDLVSGVLTVTHGLWTYSSESSVVSYSTKNEFRIIWLDFGSGYAPYSASNYAVFGDQYTKGINTLNYTNPAVYTVNTASSSATRVFLKVRLTDLPTDNIAGAKAFLNSTKPTFWTPLSTAQTIQLTAKAINAIRGTQTVSSTAGAVGIAYWTH